MWTPYLGFYNKFPSTINPPQTTQISTYLKRRILISTDEWNKNLKLEPLLYSLISITQLTSRLILIYQMIISFIPSLITCPLKLKLISMLIWSTFKQLFKSIGMIPTLVKFSQISLRNCLFNTRFTIRIWMDWSYLMTHQEETDYVFLLPWNNA